MHLHVFLNFVFSYMCSITMHFPWADAAIFTLKWFFEKNLPLLLLVWLQNCATEVTAVPWCISKTV